MLNDCEIINKPNYISDFLNIYIIQYISFKNIIIEVLPKFSQ